MKRGTARAILEVMPKFVPPCLATQANAAPTGDNWVHEIKFDGYRLQARIENRAVHLYTRNGHDWTNRFTTLAKALLKLQVTSAIIDGEVVVEDKLGRSNFSMLVSDIKAGNSARLVFYAFDLLFLNTCSTAHLALAQRKTLLQKILRGSAKSGSLRFSKHIVGNGAGMLEEACKMGLEGIVSKRIDLPYRSGRRGDWTKAKCILNDEFVVVGYLDSKAIKNAIGALVLGYYENGELIYAGRVGTGFDFLTATDLWTEVQALRIGRCPLRATLAPAQRRGVKWVKPKLVAQIEYRAWTGDGLLRHAAFKALRQDKIAKQVKRPAATAHKH